METPYSDDFALAQGGPAYKIFCRTGLADGELHKEKLRALVIVAIAWVPLLILTLIDSSAYGANSRIAFLNDFSIQAKFLIALPILLVSESFVNLRLGQYARAFVTRAIVREADIPKFRAAIETTHRLRDSWMIELCLLLVVLIAGTYFWRTRMALESATWYATPVNSSLNLTPAGYWLVFVSTPIIQFFTVRWYARFFIWFWFLRQVSKLNLNIVPSHPDRVGGLGFLPKATYSFAPILFAQGTTLSGRIASAVVHEGRDLMSFRVDAVLFVVFFVSAVVSPMLAFVPGLIKAKRRGLAEFGGFASAYTNAFESTWFSPGTRQSEALGSGDIQSLADLGNSFAVVREMNLMPFDYKDLLRLVAVAAAPLIPLLFLIFSPEEILEKLISFAL